MARRAIASVLPDHGTERSIARAIMEATHIPPGPRPMTTITASLTDLAALTCRPLKGAEHLLPAREVERLMGLLPGWSVSEEGRGIRREYRFRQYFETMAFVNAVAWIAHREDHHPDLEVGYSRCLVGLSTHEVGGLSLNDFIVAAKIEALGTLR